MKNLRRVSMLSVLKRAGKKSITLGVSESDAKVERKKSPHNFSLQGLFP